MHNQLVTSDAFKGDMNVFTFKEDDGNSLEGKILQLLIVVRAYE